MSLKKKYSGYRSFDYLEEDVDYKGFKLADQIERVEPYIIPLSPEEEERVKRIVDNNIMISLHDHPVVFPDNIEETPEYVREGRMATAYEGLARSCWDAVFDNFMDGLCHIESKSGWKWRDVLYDLGIRFCDLAHQDFVIRAEKVDDIIRAHNEGKIALIPSIEGAAMIENELDRIEILYGFGVRAMGITYSESNALGSGLKEERDGGLTFFGRQAVERMNKVGMLIDCSHCGEQTTLDVIKVSKDPIILSHVGARALWDTNRMKSDEVLKACADKGGVIGIEAAPHTTLTEKNKVHSIDSFMEHFEYIKDLVGIDHVGFGPDTLYGDHVGMHRVYSAKLSIKEAFRGSTATFQEVEYVRGLENPTEASWNIVRWLVKHGYSDEDIAKVMGKNILRVLKEVWK